MFLLNLVKGSLQDELDSFYQTLLESPFDQRVITKSALSQARRHLSHGAFIELSERFVAQYYRDNATKLWKGFRLCAIDGSTVRLPDKDALISHFGGQGNGVKQSTYARLSQCYDLLNGITVDLRVCPYSEGERHLAWQHIRKSQANDLLIYDRGYPAFWFFSLHRDYERDFCMRAPGHFLPEIEAFSRSKRIDQVVTLSLSKHSKARSHCIKQGLSCEPMPVRLIKIVLPSGEKEILITTLTDREQFPHKVFKELYAKRWGIEEDYKRQKSRLEIENFSGLTAHAVYQDIYAKVFMKNIAMAMANYAQKSVEKNLRHRIHRYKVNITHAISKMKHFLIRFLKSADPTSLVDLFIKLLEKTSEPVRSGRSYPRKVPKSPGKPFHINYKRAY